MSSESTSPGWPWSGIDPAAWMRNWWTTFGLAPQSLTQPILPGWTITINGINSSAPQTEVEVVQRHSYGRQLGRMADALQALIEERGEGAPDDDRFKEFTRMKQEIDEIKLDAAATRLDRLRDDLAALKVARPTEYRRLRDALQRMLDQ
jgi:capsular polysaccharide biosynthesis protein